MSILSNSPGLPVGGQMLGQTLHSNHWRPALPNMQSYSLKMNWNLDKDGRWPSNQSQSFKMQNGYLQTNVWHHSECQSLYALSGWDWKGHSANDVRPVLYCECKTQRENSHTGAAPFILHRWS